MCNICTPMQKMKRYSTGYHLPAYVTSYFCSTYDKMSICSKYVPRNAMMEGQSPLGYGPEQSMRSNCGATTDWMANATGFMK